jgi:fructose-1,6-bisphosphatase
MAMPHRPTTFSKLLLAGGAEPGLIALLGNVQDAVRCIGSAIARAAPGSAGLDTLASDIVLTTCEWGGQLGGMISAETGASCPVGAHGSRGPYLLAFDALDRAANLEIGLTAGTIFSVLRAPDAGAEPSAADFLQPGAQQVVAGFALYGPKTMLVASLGTGVHGFTLDRETDAFTLTHPDMRIPATARGLAIDASEERTWEMPVRRYVADRAEGEAGPRGAEFRRHGITSLAAETFRLLVRGGLLVCPGGPKEAARPLLLHQANPLALLVEQAGGLASTGRRRILDAPPAEIRQRVPAILGSREEAERLVRYCAAFDRGEAPAFESPLFSTRSLLRGALAASGA